MVFETRPLRETASNALFALATTTATAAALFASVGVNPREESFGDAPWYYAVGCAVASALFSVLYRWLDRTLRPVGVPVAGQDWYDRR